MKRLLKAPLFHFLLFGLGLFLLFYFTGNSSGTAGDRRTVRVDQEALLTFIQYRSKAFNRARFIKVLGEMKGPELQRLIRDFVEEEVLYREAQALGLERDDYVIRRRLVQKIRFISQGITTNNVKLSDADILRYYEANQKVYSLQPHITFTHVFFDNEKHGQKKAERLAKLSLATLNRDKISFARAITHGDRFLYHVNYVEKEADLVASHFSEAMAKQLFALKAVEGVWHGPYQSPYGFHLVMVTAKMAGRTPKLEEVRGRVYEDATQAAIRKRTEGAIQAIIKRYKIQVVYSNPAQKSGQSPLKSGVTNPRSRRAAGATSFNVQPVKSIGVTQP